MNENQLKKGLCFGDFRRQQILFEQARERAIADAIAGLGKKTGRGASAAPEPRIILDERYICCRSSRMAGHGKTTRPKQRLKKLGLGRMRFWNDSHGPRGRK